MSTRSCAPGPGDSDGRDGRVVRRRFVRCAGDGLRHFGVVRPGRRVELGGDGEPRAAHALSPSHRVGAQAQRELGRRDVVVGDLCAHARARGLFGAVVRSSPSRRDRWAAFPRLIGASACDVVVTVGADSIGARKTASAFHAAIAYRMIRTIRSVAVLPACGAVSTSMAIAVAAAPVSFPTPKSCTSPFAICKSGVVPSTELSSPSPTTSTSLLSKTIRSRSRPLRSRPYRSARTQDRAPSRQCDDSLDDQVTISHNVAGGDYAANRTTSRKRTHHRPAQRRTAHHRVHARRQRQRRGTATCCTMKPNTEPGATVTLTSTVNGASDVTVSPSSVSFPTTDRSTEKTFTVGAATDADVADALASISYRVRGSDYEPGNVTALDIAVSVTDAGDEVTGVALTASHPEIRDGDVERATITHTRSGADHDELEADEVTVHESINPAAPPRIPHRRVVVRDFSPATRATSPVSSTAFAHCAYWSYRLHQRRCVTALTSEFCAAPEAPLRVGRGCTRTGASASACEGVSPSPGRSALPNERSSSSRQIVTDGPAASEANCWRQKSRPAVERHHPIDRLSRPCCGAHHRPGRRTRLLRLDRQARSAPVERHGSIPRPVSLPPTVSFGSRLQPRGWRRTPSPHVWSAPAAGLKRA